MNESKLNNSSGYKKEGLPDVLGALIIMTIGLLLLANNFQVVSWSVWGYIFKFWPVIFVFIGLDMISNDSFPLKLVTTMVGIIIITFILLYSLYSVDANIRKYINTNYPAWEKIYNLIPQSKNNVNSPYEVIPLPNRFSI